ncbi:MAG: thioredoxin family protein [Thermocrispum sp.]
MDETNAGVIREADDATFGELVEVNDTVLVEFYATWCGNCRRFAPTVAKLAVDYAGRVPFLAVNVDENPQLVRRFGVSSTPTLMLLEAGQPVGTLVGAQPAAAVRDLLDTPPAGRGAAAPAGWAPPEACALPSAERPLRMAEFDALFATALRGLERPQPTWLRLRLNADDEGAARELLERESACCDFFDFRLSATDVELHLDVRVPPRWVEVLDGVERQAESALARAGSA